MAAVTVSDGNLVTQDPSDVLVYEFDWDDALTSTASIVSSIFTLTRLKGPASPALTQDNDDILSNGRGTLIRLSTIAAGAKWRVDNRIVTDESPTQTIERSFFVLGQQK
jgi:hypothetical protein